MENINDLCFKLEQNCDAFVVYTESIKWYIVKLKFPFTNEIFIVTKQCCESKEKLDKRYEEIIGYLKDKKLI